MISDQNKHYENLLDEAATWVAHLRSDDVSLTSKHHFSKWLNLSKKHEQAFDEVLDTWETLGAAAYLPLELDEIEPSRPFTQPSTFNIFKAWPSFSGLQVGTVFASLCCVLALIYHFFPTPTKITYSATFVTEAGQQQHIELPDGSRLELNTQSAINVTYTDKQRNLTLDRGEAYFDVAPNKQLPFIVTIKQGEVEAVGTAFNIYVQDKESLISVTEGVVKVTEKPDNSALHPQSKRLKVKQQIRLNRKGLGQISRFDLEQAIAWRENTLIFSDIRLPEAISELNRYLKRPVNAEDASLSMLRVSGTFSLEAPEATLQALITSFNLKTEQPSTEAPLYLRFE